MSIPSITSNIPSSIHSKGSGSYPFADSATMMSVEGIKLPGPAIQDARIYTLGGSENQYVSGIRVTSDRAMITISDGPRGEIASGTLVAGDTMNLLDSLGRPAGVLRLNMNVLRATTKIPFTLEFTSQGLPFCGSCIIPSSVTGVNGISVGEDFLSGDITLIGEDGVVIKRSDNNLKLHIIGDRLSARRACEKEDANWSPPRPIKEIVVNSNISLIPDEFGNITITGGPGRSVDNVIRVIPEENGIALKILGNFD